jgi:ABC-type branched-subunit amino acid transport system substrate-binding protein
MLRGFELAREHINAQHAHVGPQISFMIEEDKSSVEGAIEVFVGWVKRITPNAHHTQLTVPNLQRHA